ncbi:MAG: DUF2628 domain-containing protein [Bacilli bacterium]
MNNNSNNNMFNNNNITSRPNNTIGVNPPPESNNSTDNVNSTSIPSQNNLSQINQNTQLFQTQQINNQVNNTSSPTNTINPIFMNNESTTQNNENIQPLQSQQINNQVNNTSSTINTINPIFMNNESTIQNNQNNNSNIPPQQSFTSNTFADDDELLRAFIGNNYDKITTRPFNFAGFIFNSLYMFYRKMFGYAILVFILNLIVLNVIKKYAITLAFNIVIGLFVNKIYLAYAKKKIAIIKANNPQKSIEELKEICSTKGGTSIGKIFLGFITEIGIAIIISIVMMFIGIGSFIGEFFNPDDWNIIITDNDNESVTLAENVTVNGYSCFNLKCTVTIEDSNNITDDYVLSVNNSELFNILGNYKDYIKLNIYYTQNGNDKTIVDYKILLKSNNEDISSVDSENELRDKIGLYSTGTHTDSFTLSKIGTTGIGLKDDTSYTYTSYTFVDSKNIEYVMKYINSNGTLNLVEGNKYSVTFEVTEDTFEYEYIIKSIQ